MKKIVSLLVILAFQLSAADPARALSSQLYHAVAILDDAKKVEALLAQGASPEPYASQIFASVIQNQNAQILKLLLDANMDANLQVGSPVIFTPLHTAAANNWLEGVLLLLEHGADPHTTDQNNKAPYDLATNPEIRQLLTPSHTKDTARK